MDYARGEGATVTPALMGKRIAAIREAQGLGLREAARQCKIDATKLSDAESGKDSRASTVVAIALGLGVSADYLLGLSDRPGDAAARRHPEAVEDLVTLRALAGLGRETSQWLVELVDALRLCGIELPDLPPPPGAS